MIEVPAYNEAAQGGGGYHGTRLHRELTVRLGGPAIRHLYLDPRRVQIDLGKLPAVCQLDRAHRGPRDGEGACSAVVVRPVNKAPLELHLARVHHPVVKGHAAHDDQGILVRDGDLIA